MAFAKLLDRLERQWHRMGELWERCQGKGWPDAESNEFTALRDDKTPANRAALLDLYTRPPAREWVGLTDQQIADIVVEMNGNEPTGLFWRDLARAIESKLREKNA